jgi:PTS system nitrogen regulatory IIA component
MGLGWFLGKGDKESGTPKRPRPSSGGAKGSVSLGRLLSDGLVVISEEGLKKEALIEKLVRQLCEKRNLGDPKVFLNRVLEREQGISTTLDTGLAVPHARMDDLDNIAAIFALVPGGLPDPKQPDLVIKAMFLFFSPNRQEAFTQHLHLLRGVSSLFQPEFIDELQTSANGEEIHKRITEKETAV